MKNLPIRKKMILLYVNMTVFTLAYMFIMFSAMNSMLSHQQRASYISSARIGIMQQIQAALVEQGALAHDAATGGANAQEAFNQISLIDSSIQSLMQSYIDLDAGHADDPFIQAARGDRAAALEGMSNAIAAQQSAEGHLAAYFAQTKAIAKAAVSQTNTFIDGMQAESAADSSLMTRMIWFSAGFIVVYVLITLFIGRYLAKLIAFPARDLAIVAGRIAKGETDVRVEYTSRDEMGRLADAFRAMLSGIKAQSDLLHVIANGDYTGDIEIRSEQDAVNRAIRDMLGSNNDLVSSIRLSAEHVSTGAQQIAQGAQSLAEGSTEQAASVEEVSHTITSIMERSDKNAQSAQRALSLTQDVSARMNQSLSSMEEMLKAMKEIDESSRNIQSVIKIIDNIAFQTNLLALNAAVEAAHAGQHGQGFAVVAGEVRALAAQSTAAAKNTTELIENSVRNVEHGNRLVGQTNANLQAAGESVLENLRIIEQIAKQSEAQSESINAVGQKVLTISDVVQMNSANAQESAAAAEQMSAQASILSDAVSRFRLKEDASIGAAPIRPALPASAEDTGRQEYYSAPMRY